MADRAERINPKWDTVLKDIQSFLKADAVVDINSPNAAESLAEMFQVVIPALSRRFCELASRLSPTDGSTSASVMICHANDTKNGVLALRVLESFPNYGLDRTINTREGKWNLHLRYVHYRDVDNPSLNSDVVAQALIHQQNTYKRVREESRTVSEKEENILGIQTLIPKQIGTIEDVSQIKPGTIVALNIDFYDNDAIAREYLDLTMERTNILASLFSGIYEISLLQSLSNEERQNRIKQFFESFDKSKIISMTLQEIVRQVFLLISK